jgi:hypothetical protein
MTHPKHTGPVRCPDANAFRRAIDRPLWRDARPHSGRAQPGFSAGAALIGSRRRALVPIGPSVIECRIPIECSW